MPGMITTADPAGKPNVAAIRRLMREHGLSAQEAADRMCVSLYTVQRWFKPRTPTDAKEWHVRNLRESVARPDAAAHRRESSGPPAGSGSV